MYSICRIQNIDCTYTHSFVVRTILRYQQLQVYTINYITYSGSAVNAVSEEEQIEDEEEEEEDDSAKEEEGWLRRRKKKGRIRGGGITRRRRIKTI